MTVSKQIESGSIVCFIFMFLYLDI